MRHFLPESFRRSRPAEQAFRKLRWKFKSAKILSGSLQVVGDTHRCDLFCRPVPQRVGSTRIPVSGLTDGARIHEIGIPSIELDRLMPGELRWTSRKFHVS